MSKQLSKIIVHLGIILGILAIFCIIAKNNLKFELIIYSLFFILLLLSVIFWKSIKTELLNNSIDRYISLIGIEIALLVFIQASLQFERNRIDSENMYQTQMQHSKSLNDSLIIELIAIQKVNENQNLIVEKQLELSKQSLNDYISNNRANIVLGVMEITNIDTLDKESVYIKITNKLFNEGNRTAEKIEVRFFIMNPSFKFTNLYPRSLPNMPRDDVREVHFRTKLPLANLENFYLWIQIRYYDNKMKQLFDDSYYFNYYNMSGTSNFYFVKDGKIPIIRKIIDKELARQGLSLTIN